MIRGPSQLQPPGEIFLLLVFCPGVGFPLWEPPSFSSSTSLLANCCLSEQNRVCNLLPGSPLPPSLLAKLGFLFRWGWSPGQEGEEPAAAWLLPAASLLFLSPFPPPSPHPDRNSASHFLGMLGAQTEPAVLAGSRGLSGLVSPKSAARRWGGHLQEREAAHSFLPGHTRPSPPRRSRGPPPPTPCRFPPPSFRVLAEPSHCSRQASVTADPGRGRGGD